MLSAALERTGIASRLARSLLRTVGTGEVTLIMGPGGYRFGDYARVGAPLAVVLSVVLLVVVATVYMR